MWAGWPRRDIVAARYLPRSKARGAHQMSTRLNLDVFVILCADLTELESGAHFTIQFILFLEYREKRPMLMVFKHEVLISNFLNYNDFSSPHLNLSELGYLLRTHFKLIFIIWSKKSIFKTFEILALILYKYTHTHTFGYLMLYSITFFQQPQGF